MSSTACLKDSLNDYKTVLGLFEVELIGTLVTDYLKSVTFGIFRCRKGGVYVLYSCRPEVIDIFLGGRSPKNISHFWATQYLYSFTSDTRLYMGSR